MANILGNPQLVSDKARENQVLSYNTTLTSEPAAANPLLRVRIDSTTLVDFPLHATTPLTIGAIDGACAFAFASAEELAVGGLASMPDNYQIIGRDGTVHLSGNITATDHITIDQAVAVDSLTLGAPATP